MLSPANLYGNLQSNNLPTVVASSLDRRKLSYLGSDYHYTGRIIRALPGQHAKSCMVNEEQGYSKQTNSGQNTAFKRDSSKCLHSKFSFHNLPQETPLLDVFNQGQQQNQDHHFGSLIRNTPQQSNSLSYHQNNHLNFSSSSTATSASSQTILHQSSCNNQVQDSPGLYQTGQQQQQPQIYCPDNIIYLDDALQLLNVSVENCLQFNPNHQHHQ